MAPQLVKMGWGWESLDQTLPSPPGELFFLLLPQTHREGGVSAAAEKGAGWIRLTEFYKGHKVSWRNSPEGSRRVRRTLRKD